jgi:murein DD-endopeptidase MepM/ murein hydrolase activator NlpD
MLFLASCDLSQGLMKSKAIDDKYHLSHVIVAQGDTAASIATQHHVSLTDLLKINHLKKNSSLQAGQTIKLPKYKQYKVKKHDNLNKIAQMFDLDEGLIASVNNLKFPFVLKENSFLKIPGNIVSLKEQQALAKIDNTTYQAVPVPTVRERDLVANELPLKTQNHISNIWPIDNPEVIEYFAHNNNGVKSEGIRLKAQLNTPVKAIAKGVVIYVGYNSVFGNLLIIKHDDDLMSAYAHLSSALVQKADVVTKGEHIAQTGDSGDVEHSQLYLAIKVGEEAVDPLLYLPRL